MNVAGSAALPATDSSSPWASSPPSSPQGFRVAGGVHIHIQTPHVCPHVRETFISVLLSSLHLRLTPVNHGALGCLSFTQHNYKMHNSLSFTTCFFNVKGSQILYSVQHHLNMLPPAPGPSRSAPASLWDADSPAGSLGIHPSPLLGSGCVIFVPEDAKIV